MQFHDFLHKSVEIIASWACWDMRDNMTDIILHSQNVRKSYLLNDILKIKSETLLFKIDEKLNAKKDLGNICL